MFIMFFSFMASRASYGRLHQMVPPLLTSLKSRQRRAEDVGCFFSSQLYLLLSETLKVVVIHDLELLACGQMSCCFNHLKAKPIQVCRDSFTKKLHKRTTPPIYLTLNYGTVICVAICFLKKGFLQTVVPACKCNTK